MKETGAPDRKGAGYGEQSKIMMREVGARTICDLSELASFVFELVVFSEFYFSFVFLNK